MPTPEENQKPKIVWIACRATEGCTGNQAEIVFSAPTVPVGADGSFLPTAGGKATRYVCLTCKMPFHIRT